MNTGVPKGCSKTCLFHNLLNFINTFGIRNENGARKRQNVYKKKSVVFYEDFAMYIEIVRLV